MSDDEKLREYLRKNAEKEALEPETPKEEPPAGKSMKSPLEWYNSDKIKGIFVITGFLTFFPFCILAWVNSEWGVDMNTCILVGAVIWGTGMAINVGVNGYRMSRYGKWVRGEYYKLVGWNEFFANRSKKYWGRTLLYTNARITFNLTPNATDVQREAIKVFTANLVKDWNKDHDEMDWEPGKGSPKTFSTDGKAIAGDVSERNLRMIITALVPKFIPLAKLIGPNLANVTITGKGDEREYFVKEDKEDAHDRNESWNRRHS